MTDRTDAPITFVIFTYNESARIERAVRNLRGSGPVLVVDNHSNDDTVARAERAGARVVLHRNPGWVEDEGTAAVVKAAVSTPWIYWGYADEMLSRHTLDHISERVRSGECDVITLSRDNYYYGRHCHRAFSGGPLPRAFKKEAIDFAGNKIHYFGRMTVADDRVHHADRRSFFIHHFISNTAQTYLRSYERYTDVEAEHGSAPHPVSLIFGAVRMFVGNYIVRGGYKAGREGLYFSLQMVYFDWLAAMKRFERQHGYDVAGIERINDALRDVILAEQDKQSG